MPEIFRRVIHSTYPILAQFSLEAFCYCCDRSFYFSILKQTQHKICHQMEGGGGDSFAQGMEDNINYKSIRCECIPELFLDKLVAKKHFSRFGKINRFVLRPSRMCCTVDYENEEDAAYACENAGRYNGHEFIVKYGEKEVGHVQNTEEWVSPEVRSELDAMNQGSGDAAASYRRRSPMTFMTQRSMKPAMLRQPKSLPWLPALATERPPQPKTDTLRSELEAVMRKPAYTNEEKYRVLDSRDKLIRLTTVRQTDIKNAVSIKGFCPDMCPEKERLMREFQRQVSVYETNSDVLIDHRRAIKEYSRSSADQEVPLAHELRPEAVLQMTMRYLMHRIMDLCEDPQISIAEWFHFVWDRTRSIRKDITQQELCSLGTVELVEQCARFHIHCGARLVAEDPSVFDKKINAENLTKCLQTLKYMYHDLRIKQVRCPCEAEFRGYIVLLNLGNANFLWELKQLPHDIQRSAHIKRAIAFYNALQNNNYVRFFNMVRAPETSYLSACILLGYFTKLRLKAMDAIVKSYTWRKHPSYLPLVYLTRVLGFEDTEEAADFFSAHGLQCQEDRVKLDRLKRPDVEYGMDRAMTLVESKRKVSVGECVCGHPLDSLDVFEKHQPHNSFDQYGLLKPESWTAEDQLRGEVTAAASKQLNSSQPQSQQEQQQFVNVLPAQQKLTSPSGYTSDNIFKVPLSTPPISPKQVQQKQQQQIGATSTNTSVIGGNIFGAGLKGPTTSSQQPTFASLFRASYSSTSSTPTAGGAPATLTSSQLPTQKPTIAMSSASPIFTSGFMQDPGEQKPSSIDAKSFKRLFREVVPMSVSSNIFGAAARETANLFHQHQRREPKPLHADNIFKHFETAAPAFGEVRATNASIFGAPTATTVSPTTQTSTDDSYHRRKAANEDSGWKLLEKEHRGKLAEFDEERRKLKALEEESERLRQAAERKARMEASDRQALELLDTLLDELIRTAVAAEYEKHLAIGGRAAQLMTQLIDEYVLEEVEAIQNEEFALLYYDKTILQRYFGRWLQATRNHSEQRMLMHTMPVWASEETEEQRSQQLQHPQQDENLQMAKRYRHGEPCDFKVTLSPEPGGSVRTHSLIDFFRIISQYVAPISAVEGGLMRRQKFFKLLLTLPGDKEELLGFESMCNRWLRKYVRQPERTNDDGNCYINEMFDDVGLCVRKLTGTLLANEAGQPARKHECDNADAIICLMTCDNLYNTRRRLHHLLELSKTYKALPIGFVIYNAGGIDKHDVTSGLGMDDALVKERVSSYEFFGCEDSKSSFSFYSNFKRAARFVVRENSVSNAPSESLEMLGWHTWLIAVLGEGLWQRWFKSAMENPVFNKICTMPRFVVELYNDALRRLEEIVREDVQEEPEFPEELRQFVPPVDLEMPQSLEHFPQDWKDPRRREKFLSFLNSIKLPPVDEQQLMLADAIEDFQLGLLNYASLCVGDDDEAATRAARHAIRIIIKSLNSEDMQSLGLRERLSSICWLPVIKPIAFARIYHEVKAVAITLPTEIIYRRRAFYYYQQMPWWLNLHPLDEVVVDHAAEDESKEESGASHDAKDEVDAIIQQAEAVSRQADESLFTLKQQVAKSAQDGLVHQLDQTFYEIELAKKCGTLTTALPNDDDDDGELLGAEGEAGTSCKQQLSVNLRKRKMDGSPASEVEVVMTKALALIEKVDSREDRIRAKPNIVLERADL